MSSIKDKLKQFDTSSKALHKAQVDSSVQSHPDFSAIQTPYGEHLLRQKRFANSTLHGHATIEQIYTIQPKTIAYLLKDTNFYEFNIEKALFIDTETTGLAGGTGTYAFLVGIGRFSGDEFVIKQFLLQNLSQESAQLHSIITEAENSKYIVSYNGKAYDLPLLQTRFIINRLENPFLNAYHIDLLHVNRRYYQKIVNSCSLQQMEKYLLGFQRQDDIPGSEIPQRYFQFLRSQNLQELISICKHNVIDILSMVAFIIENAKIFVDEEKSQPFHHKAKLQTLLHFQEHENAQNFIDSIATSDIKLLLLHAAFFKKTKQVLKAQAIWEQLCSKAEFLEEPFIELAKLYEHQYKQPEMALTFVDRLLKKVEIRQQLGRTPFNIIDDLHKRRNRLLKKIESSINCSN